MDAVGKTRNNGPVIVGFGTNAQEPALLEAGAERVYTSDQKAFVLDHLGMSLRYGDTLLLVQPALLRKPEMERIAKVVAYIQVVGHDPVPSDNSVGIDALRRKKPKHGDAPLVQTTGRPPKIKYSEAQARAIIRLWHSVPRIKPAEIVRTSEAMLDLPEGTLKPHWPRDLVIKYVGTAQRDKPANWTDIVEAQKE